jgi:hypothetical protein
LPEGANTYMEALEEVIAYFTKLALTVLLSKIEKIELPQNTQLEVHPSTMMYRFKNHQYLITTKI